MAALHFGITFVQTVTFPIPKNTFSLNKTRRFFLSASDGGTTKETGAVLLKGTTLSWNETLEGFVVTPASQLILQVWEAHNVRSDKLLATFSMPYQMLSSSLNNFSVPATHPASSSIISVTLSTRFAPPVEQRPSTLTRTRDTADNPFLDPPSITDRVESSRSRFLEAKEAAKKLKSPSTLAAGILSENVDLVFDHTETISNTTRFLGIWKHVSDQLGFIVTAVDTIAEIHPFAKLAWSVISFIPKRISKQIQLDEEIMGLLDAMEKALDLAPDAETLRCRCKLSQNHEETLKLLMDQISECGRFIHSYLEDANFWKRLVKNGVEDRHQLIENYRQTLRDLREDFLSDIILAVEKNVFRMLTWMESITENITELDLSMKLRELPYGEGTGFNPGRRCLPHTRVKFLDAISDWVNNPSPSAPKVLMLFGQAGTGKSSIAHEIAHRFNGINRLATSYFFVRGTPSGSEPYRFFTTLATDLCRILPAFKAALGRLLRDNPQLAHVRSYTTLVKSLLQDPLKDLYSVGPVLIVIDALDENEDAVRKQLYAGGNIVPFHVALSQCLSGLPSNFRTLITSRPEAELEKAFPESVVVRRIHMNDPQLADGVDNDIFIYTREKLREAGIDENALWKLAKRAEGLFQWAYVACDYISHPPPGLNTQYCLDEVLYSSQVNDTTERLDNLYNAVLSGHFNMERRQISNNFQSVMGQVLGTFRPLSISSLHTMRQLAADRSAKTTTNISDVVRYMGSLLSNVTPHDSTLPIIPFHTSFRDFLTDSKRSHKFYVDLNKSHEELAYATLRTMQAMLRFNICRLETSYQLNSDIPDVNDRIDEYIPSALSYACRFWSLHLANVSTFNAELFKSIRILIDVKFLFWLEVLSLKGEMAIATTALLGLREWLGQMQDRVLNQEIRVLDILVKDAISFVRYFGYPMAQSAPHIYLSALPFAPFSSLIARLYSPRLSRTLEVKQGRLPQWPALLMAISVPDKAKVVCVAWSWNGDYVAGGLNDGNVSVWDASTGTRVVEPFVAGIKNRFDWENIFVSSITFSHDGRCLASGLSDGRIRVWKLTTGQGAMTVVGEKRALNVNSGAVSALSFSEDDKLLISGSRDGMVVVWDLERGGVAAGPFGGHKNPVWAVSFLPDQKHILSRSGFRTIRIWNMRGGYLETKPFKLRNMEIPVGTINAAIYFDNHLFRDSSPTGSGFTSGSWAEAMAYEEEGYNPSFRDGPCYWFVAATISCDGRLVATSTDKCIHIWYASGKSAGKLAGGPFQANSVTCLAFSMDGQRVVSGSLEGVVRVWNVGRSDDDITGSQKQVAPKPLGFTPDIREILLEQNGTVQVLDVSTGREVMKFRDRILEDYLYGIVAASPSRDLVALAWDDRLQIKTRSGEVVNEPLDTGDNGIVACVTFSPDVNELVACCMENGVVFVFDALTGEVMAGPEQVYNDELTALQISPSTVNSAMPYVVAVSYQKVFIWHIQSGRVTGPFNHHQNQDSTLMISADARAITSVDADYTLRVWDPMTGDIVRGPAGLTDAQKVYAQESCSSITLTRSGRRVAFTGKHNTIHVFEVVYKRRRGVSLRGPLILGGHTDELQHHMIFSRDGRFLATSSYDVTLRVWDIETAAKHKKIMDGASDFSAITNFTEAFVDDDGWVICPHKHAYPPLRLMWIPEMHRKSLYWHRPTYECVVGFGCRNESLVILNLENFVHGKQWVHCNSLYNQK